jgi:serine/threonine-protein kinase Chk1
MIVFIKTRTDASMLSYMHRVRLLVNKETREALAVKIINLNRVALDNASDTIKKEICIMKMLQSPLFIHFYGSRTEGNIQYLFLEYASGGELFDRIEPDVGMDQNQARTYFQQLIHGVEFIHSKGITHRDLKPENILLDENDNIKITDFGLSTVFRHQGQERKLSKRCGTTPYIAPEVLGGEEYYAQPADIWSCGVILVAMLSGELPWQRPDRQCKEFSDYCTKKSLRSPWIKISNWPLSLIRKLLREVPAERATILQIKQHRWFSKRAAVMSCDGQLSPSASSLKRPCSNTPDTPPSNLDFVHHFPMLASQPEPQKRQSIIRELMTKRVFHVADAAESGSCNEEKLSVCSFSQPVPTEYEFLSSQISSTPCRSQMSFQRYVKRMTRFETGCGVEKTWKLLLEALAKLGCLNKSLATGEIVVSINDRTKSDLVFKISLFPVDEKQVLVDLRRSKGDGLEFKRYFLRIRNLMKTVLV